MNDIDDTRKKKKKRKLEDLNYVSGAKKQQELQVYFLPHLIL